MIVNNFLVERWEFYKERFDFPYERPIGAKGGKVRFEEGEASKILGLTIETIFSNVHYVEK